VALYELIEDLDLDAPAVILALDGWIDAGMAAQQARQTLLDTLDTTTVATFDTDRLLDFRARRPTMNLVDGVLTGLQWPALELRAASDVDGNDLLLLIGAEPDHQWRAFAGDVVDLFTRFDARIVVGIGAYPAAVPHTRPTRLAAAASTADLARFCAVRTTVDVPTGVQGVIERTAADSGISAIGLWAQVPHYVSGMPAPSAAAALVDGLGTVTDLVLPSDELHAQAQALRGRLDELVGANREHTEMVRQLEEQWDEEAAAGASTDTFGSQPLPSGDELAAELERFLRDQET
jgi:proteasome assembly chaperone (PAC2) family protein